MRSRESQGQRDDSLKIISPEIKLPKRGANIYMRIYLVRHPEKDYATDRLTEKGKQCLRNFLSNGFHDQTDFDLSGFYTSTLSRGKEAGDIIDAMLSKQKKQKRVKSKKELSGKASEFGTTFWSAFAKELKDRNSLVIALTEPSSPGEAWSYKVTDEEEEAVMNQLLVRDFFDDKFPGSDFTGKEMGEGIGALIKYFSKVASRLQSGRRVKLLLISHGGIIEHYIKTIYLQTHQEKEPHTVDADMMGGLVGYLEGPVITIQSDAAAIQSTVMDYNDIHLAYPQVT